MKTHHFWMSYPETYRAKEMQTIANWIVTGESGSVLGLVGCGRSHLLGFLSHRVDVLRRYLPDYLGQVVLIPVDLYNLPTQDLSSLYRFILHEFYWGREQFSEEIQQVIIQLYMENRTYLDPFLPQMALYELLLLIQSKQVRVVLILNRFNQFCETATPPMMNTLRALRDSFRETLIFIVGMRNDISYLTDPESLGDLYDLLVGHICWVGALADQDAMFMLQRHLRTSNHQPTPEQVGEMMKLSGNFPSLLRAILYWWTINFDHLPAINEWSDLLFQENSIRHRLERIWESLTQAEQLVLNEIYTSQLFSSQEKQLELQKMPGHVAARPADSTEQKAHFKTLAHQLEAKGICQQVANRWEIPGQLVVRFAQQMVGNVRGGMWLDEKTRNVYQGQAAIEELTHLEYAILRFLIKHPRIKHSRDQVIDHAWPDEDQREGITPNALQVHIRNIRRKIEIDPANPRYLITWHGRPGGYQFFPEGKPL
ncbi:MAG: hypothetical protein Fur0022_08760 [Anaerolineales bacterium]